MIKNVVEKYLFMVFVLAVMASDITVTLYAVQDSKLSVRTRRLPVWYGSKTDAMRSGKPIVQVVLPISRVIGHYMGTGTRGSVYTLMHGDRLYAQNKVRKVRV
jgi:hypothetical protein